MDSSLAAGNGEHRGDADHPCGALGPLAGVHIVSIAQNVPGPLAVRRLVEWGATALKVEPLAGDPFAPMCQSWYEEMHRGVSVIRLDLKSAEGRAALGAELDAADLFITSHRPSALARLGLDPESIGRDHPRLRSIRIVGSIAEPDIPGHDLTYQAAAGLIRNRLPLTLAADISAAERVVSRALLLLRMAAGSATTIGLYDSLDWLAAPLRHGITGPSGMLGGALSVYGVYESADGFVALAALEPHFEERLRRELGLSDTGSLADVMKRRTAADWEQWARERDLPLVRVTNGAADDVV